MATILIVDDSRIQIRIIQKICQEQCPDAKILMFESGDDCLASMPRKISDVVLAVIDQNMDGISGLELISTLVSRGVGVDHIILCTANAQETVQNSAKELGVTFVRKPYESGMLGAIFQNILKSGS